MENSDLDRTESDRASILRIQALKLEELYEITRDIEDVTYEVNMLRTKQRTMVISAYLKYNFSLRQLAEAAQVDHSTVRRWVNQSMGEGHDAL